MRKLHLILILAFVYSSSFAYIPKVPKPIKPIIDYEVAEGKIDSIISLLKSDNIDDKYNAVIFFRNLATTQKTDKVKLALIDALSREVNKRCLKNEAASEYRTELIIEVASLCDPRAVPLFLNLNVRYTGPYVNWYLARMAVEPEVLDTLLYDLAIDNLGPESVLGEIVRPKSEGFVASTVLRNSIKMLLMKALYRRRDRSDTTLSREWLCKARREVVRALAGFPGDDVIMVLDSIKKNDPYKSGKRYPVREEAKRSLMIHRLIKAGLKKENTNAYDLYAKALPGFYPCSSRVLNKEQITILDSIADLYPRTIFAAYSLGLLALYYANKAKITNDNSLSAKKENLAVEYKEKAMSYLQRLIQNYSKKDYPAFLEKSEIIDELKKRMK